MYTLHNLADDLEKQSSNGYDTVQLAKWAMQTYSEKSSELDTGVKDAIFDVIVMEEGHEFEMSEEEFNAFIKQLRNRKVQ